jgi:hypothetical protein
VDFIRSIGKRQDRSITAGQRNYMWRLFIWHVSAQSVWCFGNPQQRPSGSKDKTMDSTPSKAHMWWSCYLHTRLPCARLAVWSIEVETWTVYEYEGTCSVTGQSMLLLFPRWNLSDRNSLQSHQITTSYVYRTGKKVIQARAAWELTCVTWEAQSECMWIWEVQIRLFKVSLQASITLMYLTVPPVRQFTAKFNVFNIQQCLQKMCILFK